MGFLTRLFSSPDTIRVATDGLVNGLDKAFFTPEERAEFASSANEAYKEMWLAAVPSALSRRILMCAIALTWVVMSVSTFFLYVFSDPAKAGLAYVLLRDVVNEPFMIVVGFYFLKSGVVDPIAKAYTVTQTAKSESQRTS